MIHRSCLVMQQRFSCFFAVVQRTFLVFFFVSSMPLKPSSVSTIRTIYTSSSRSSVYKPSRIQNSPTTQISLTGDVSTVARGTAFEHSSSLLLNRRFGIQLQRVGGAGDRGIDLRGWWHIPSEAQKEANVETNTQGETNIGAGRKKRLRVIAQCKAEAKKLGPVIIREFEGTLHRAGQQDKLSREASSTTSSDSTFGLDITNHIQESTTSESDLAKPAAFTDSRIIGILLSASGFSKQSALQAMSSPNPLLLIHLEAPDLQLHTALSHHFEDQARAQGSSAAESELRSSSGPSFHVSRMEEKGEKKLKRKQKGAETGTKSNGKEPRLETPTCFSVLANQAFLSRGGPLQGRMDIRWERITGLKDKAGEGAGRPILFWDGKRVDEDDVDLMFTALSRK